MGSGRGAATATIASSTQAAIDALRGDLGRIHREVEEIAERVRAIEADSARAAAIGRHAYDEEPANRRRLQALRASEEYELAFTEAA